MAMKACPWSNLAPTAAMAGAAPLSAASPTTTISAPSKTMQDIMDEALALKLYEDECRALERDLNTASDSDANVFAHMEVKTHGSQRLGAHSFADFEDYEEYYEQDEEDSELKPRAPQTLAAAAAAAGSVLGATGRNATTAAPVAPSTAPPQAAATSVKAIASGTHKKQQYDRSRQVEDAGQGFNSIREAIRRQTKDAKNGVGGGRVEASKHATRDGVLDERTERILQKLINRGELDAVHGCVQSGKEAHVYVGAATDAETLRERTLAVKVFKTTLNEFSNRHEYVTGDRRFDVHFAKKSMRRQLATWTEKEFRNLSRAVKHVRAPMPRLVKEHVLVMDFVGDNGYPAPTLKDAVLTPAQLAHAYADILQAMRTLYHDARLVHADLSEYNVLVHKHKCWLIDFGQAVDRTHPDFDAYLARDVHNVTRFFQHAGLADACSDTVGLLTEDAAFAFVASESPVEALAPFPALRALLNEKRAQQQRR